jgi:hypothetical protein
LDEKVIHHFFFEINSVYLRAYQGDKEWEDLQNRFKPTAIFTEWKKQVQGIAELENG